MPAYQALAPYDPARGRPVHPTVAGPAVVSLHELERKLGRTAFAVWKAMLQCRSEDGGVCHATLNGLAKRSDVTPRNVRRVLARLKAAKLINDVGWRVMSVFVDGSVGERRVFVRTVRGALVGHPIVDARVPEATEAWLNNANSHGGPRVGMPYVGPTPEQKALADALGWPTEVHAGPFTIDIANEELRVAIEVDGKSHGDSAASRAATSRKTAQLEVLGWTVVRFANKDIVANIDQCVRHVHAVCAPHLVPPLTWELEHEQRVSEIDARHETGGADLPAQEDATHLPSRAHAHAAPDEGASVAHAPSPVVASVAPDIYMDKKTVQTEPFPSGKTPAEVGRGPVPVFEIERQEPESARDRIHRLVSSALTTARPNVAAPILVGGPLPPYPNTALIQPATVPMPPMVNAAADDYDKARMIVNAYCGACETRLGEPCRVLKGEKSLRSSKLFAMLVDAANLLAEKKISPFAWAAWWLDSHVERGRKDRPPIQVVFGNKSVGDHVKRNIFRRSGKIYGGRVVFGAKHLELIRRYEDMRQHLRTIAFTSEADVAAVVNEHFPPGDWGLLLEEAQKEAAALKDHHAATLQRGGFLW